ncbi:MAG: glycoside hydrolase family 127 protein, partial [Candidatus Nealsonbacteria bacterium]|nr:glycoside hydrolase family 127 protein [Candidatus Nealsonbacteria bacterium]
LKLTRHLFAWTADRRYADYYERALYNHILASQDPKKGMTIYFCSLKPGHFHTYGTPYDSFWCCTGSGLENHVKYGDSIYFHDDASLYVNLFIASELTWKAKELKVRQETRFPDEPKTRLVVSCEKQTRLALKIRHPYWAASALEVTVNGEKFDADSKPSGYFTIDRSWNDGDVVDVTLPMSLRIEPMANSPKKVAIMYGPLVLAGQLGRDGFTENMPYSGNQKAYANLPTPDVPVLITDDKPVAEWVQRVPGKSLQFKTVGVGRPNDVSLIPFHEAHHQRFTVYWDLFTEEDWKQKEAEYKAEQQRLKALQARTVDSVVPEMQPERDHNYQGDKSSAGMFNGRHWRHAYPGGWFSYDLKIAADRPIDLLVTYWGSDVGRTFDVQIDGRKIATQTLNKQKPGEFYDVTYPIPEDLAKNKDKITVRFQAPDNSMAGGVFACRIVKRESEPSGAAALLKTLDPFYKQHVVTDGLLIVSSEKASKFALREVAYLTERMLANRPDAFEKLAERKMYVCVMAYNEMQTDLPECSKMSPWWDKRARGLGGRPVSCGEENVLCFKGDPYRGESIFIHEFAHGLHGAFAGLDDKFDARLRTLHKEAKATGRFRGYGLGTFGEFWAEGVQSWFECNRNGGLEALDADGKHLCQINSRQQLKEYLPELAKLIDEAFRQNEWVYKPIANRLDEPHLRGHDPAKAPTFRWPAKVTEAFNRIEAENAKKRKERAAKS